MTIPENPNFQIPQIRWPTEVTAANLDKIRGYRSQGMSLGTSIAGVIRDEGNITLFAPLKEVWSAMGRPDPKDFPQDLSDNSLAVDSYIKLAQRFISEEKYTFRKEPIPTSPELVELITHVFSVDNFLIPSATRRAVREELPLEEAIEKQVYTFEEILTAASINNELKRQHIRHLFETGTIIDVIDYLALLEVEKWRDADYENRPVLDAIERSRLRFHKLHEAAQKELPEQI